MPSGNLASLDVRDTTCVNVVDRAGNVYRLRRARVVACHNGRRHGNRVWHPPAVAGHHTGHPNELKGGKRPRVTLSPTIILKDGKPIYRISTPVRDNQDQALLQVILNMIEFNMIATASGGSATIPDRAFLQLFRDARIVPGKLNLEIPDSEGHRGQVGVDRPHRHGDGPVEQRVGPIVIKIADSGVREGGADPASCKIHIR